MDVTTPMGGDWLAIGIAFVAYFAVSFAWWGPLFGGKWAREMGIPMGESEGMAKSMILQVVASFLVVYVLFSTMIAFTATHGDNEILRGELSLGVAAFGAFMTWLGFFLPIQLGRVAWEKASWTLFGINAGGQLVALVIAAVIFALF